MSDQEQDQEQQGQKSDQEDKRVSDAETAFEEYAGDNKCPECDAPIIEVRANCPNCGYEYKESDYSDKEAGSEFVSGSAVDDEGNEVPDDETGTGEGGSDNADEESDGEIGRGGHLDCKTTAPSSSQV